MEKEKPPMVGLIQRGGEVVMRRREHLQQATIRPLLRALITPGTRVYTDEYDMSHRFPEWGFDPHPVCHGRGEYGRDADGDGFQEGHLNTAAGVWS